MKKGLQTATTLTIVGTVLYVLYLLTVGHFRPLPEETTLMLFVRTWTLELPFKVSCWWNLLVAPAVLLTATYCHYQREMIGEEPRGHGEKVQGKYDARMSVHSLTAVSLVFGTWMPLVSAFMQPISMDMMNGPLSGMAMGVGTFFCAYVILSIWSAAVDILFRELHFIDESTGELYAIRFVNYTKLGLLKTFPFLIGLTIGLMFRLIYEGVSAFVKTIMPKSKKTVSA